MPPRETSAVWLVTSTQVHQWLDLPPVEAFDGAGGCTVWTRPTPAHHPWTFREEDFFRVNAAATIGL